MDAQKLTSDRLGGSSSGKHGSGLTISFDDNDTGDVEAAHARIRLDLVRKDNGQVEFLRQLLQASEVLIEFLGVSPSA